MTTTEELLPLYREMFRIRRFEEESARAYAQGKIGGFLHLYIGQEAIAVGAIAALEHSDYLFQTYRDHGTALARGMTARAGMAELFGKHTGCARGLGGSMHFFDVENNFLGGWGIVGGHLSLAAGAAFKSKYLDDGRVTVVFFGEGATSIGGFHEALHLSGLWKLPIVFVCENNQYAMGTPMSRTSPVDDLTLRAPGYGMPGERFDGYDVINVRDSMKGAIDRARNGEGPTFIEISTYRFRGHSMSDPGKYRTREELEARKKFDPVMLAKQKLLDLGVTEADFEKLEDEVEEEIQDSVKFANESEPARLDVMMESIIAPLKITGDDHG